MFKNIKKVHFIGIGGIGVSALARMMILLDKKITGSDITENIVNQRIKKMGGRIFIGHKKTNLSKDVDMVIYSPAIKKDNPELMYAKKLKILIYSYPQALGLISKNNYTIAISGAHGKTSTTAMLAEAMISAKKDPTVIIGGFLRKEKDNFIQGKKGVFLVEACEYKKSFLNLFPDILVITNIDNDHLDYYKNIKNIQKSFAELISRVPKDGFIICNKKEKNTQQALKFANIKGKVIDYSRIKNIKLKVSGKHNIENAKAALSVLELIDVKKEQGRKFLGEYAGTWRRFEYKGKTKKSALIYDDYAHHPSEVKAILQAIREKFKKNKIIVVFQPHLYSRTKFLLNDFSKSFNHADQVIITDIYAAREKDTGLIHAIDLVKAIKAKRPCLENTAFAKAVSFKGTASDFVQYLSDFKDIIKYLKENTKKDDVIITIGAGDIYIIGEKLIIN